MDSDHSNPFGPNRNCAKGFCIILILKQPSIAKFMPKIGSFHFFGTYMYISFCTVKSFNPIILWVVKFDPGHLWLSFAHPKIAFWAFLLDTEVENCQKMFKNVEVRWYFCLYTPLFF